MPGCRQRIDDPELEERWWREEAIANAKWRAVHAQQWTIRYAIGVAIFGVIGLALLKPTLLVCAALFALACHDKREERNRQLDVLRRMGALR